MTALRLTWRLGRGAVAGALIVLLLAALAPLAFGGRGFSVMSGSMEPAISTGDLVVTSSIAPREAAGGDVVTFSDPEGSGRLITHRVASAVRRGGNVDFVTKGDANTNVERWSVPAGGRIGRVAYRIPKAGYALALARTPAARLGLIALPVLVLAGFALIAIWRPRREEAPDAAAPA